MTFDFTRAAAAACAALAIAAVASASPAGDRPSAPAAGGAVVQAAGYRIGADDVLSVFYWHDKDLSADVVVRPDGFISLPLLRDVPALGLTPQQLGDRITALASAYLEDPNVTVVVKQINSRRVFITGEIAKPGPYPLGDSMTILQLIAVAGGVTPYAQQDRITVVRAGDAGPVTFRFNYKKALKLEDLGSNIALRPGDTVIVP